jgi:hypothetical protein
VYNQQNKFLSFDVFELYLFSKTGALIAENVKSKNIYNTKYYKQIFPKLVRTIAAYNKKYNRVVNRNVFFCRQRKIITLDFATSNIIAIGVCSKEMKSKLLNFFLLKISMAFLNYMEMHNCKTSYNIHSIIFETLLFSPIKSHFSLAIKEVFRRYTLYINNIRYKNYYLVDLSSDEIIISLESLYEQNINGEVEMKIPNKEIWKEVLFHAHQLKNDYIKKNKNIFQIENLQDFYTKIEIKATYPRLIYIIKFLPLLAGLVLVHEYSQTKMSRLDGSTNAAYREYEIEYGYQFDEQNNFQTKSDEFLLNEPDVLINIHFFIIECLLCNLDNLGFFIFKKYVKIYFSEEIIKIINKQIYSNIKISQITEICRNKEFVHQLLEKIANRLYDEYIQLNAQETESKESAMIIKKNSDESSLNKSFFLSYPDSLYISKKFTLNTIFKSGQLNEYINPNNISLDLSSEDEDPLVDNILETLQNKKDFNKLNTPYYYSKHSHPNTESRQLMDLLNDNVSIAETQFLLNLEKNNKRNLRIEPNDLFSMNLTDLSSRRNLSRNNFFPYNPNNINNNLNPININKNIGNNIFNLSSGSSQIKPLPKIQK